MEASLNDWNNVLISESTGSRYIYELYYEKEAISKTLYEWLLKNGYADANLIAKWKKQGYEKVCWYMFFEMQTKIDLVAETGAWELI